jgi:RNA 2',3'-cyclic 3'-phosphodiesterase
MATGTDTARLFFAVWPSPAVQQALHALAQRAWRECGGRVVAQRNIHLTLAFLGNVQRARLHQIEAVADGTNGSQCDLVVECLEYWRHNRILWAGLERCPDEMRGLVGSLSAGLHAIGFKLDGRPYVPHITLLRNARRRPAVAAVPPIIWPVHDIALIESAPRNGERIYEVLQRWPLK